MSELIADIAVNAPLKQLFSYLVPAEMVEKVAVGKRVKVPFGRRTSTGFILLTRQGSSKGLKKISTLLDEEPLLTPELITLLRWAADYYCHPIGQVIRNALPAGLGSDKTQTRILYEPVYRLLKREPLPRGQKQQELLKLIAEEEKTPLSRIRQEFSTPHSSLNRLVEQGYLEVCEQEIQRDPFLYEKITEDKCLTLNNDQKNAVKSVSDSLEKNSFSPYLLHGVTGSGKTEVYLQSVEKCLNLKRQALILVPEIALTPQLVARFRARFEPKGSKLAVLHSGLSDGERYDAWRRINRNEVDIVIGARSAIFAPLSRPGLIIVDEEHETSYKQSEGFRYNARDLALVRAQQQGCTIVLGSATPSLASYYRSEQGSLQRLELPQRVHTGNLPQVELINLAEEESSQTLANPLIEALQNTLEKREQAMLLLNRRGFAPFLLCTDCGTSFHCPNCEITLTFHQRERLLRCHYCDYAEPPKEVCPNCNGGNIEPEGAGTERLEQEITELFPGARIARMDRDTTSRKGAHQRIVDKMMRREIDILIGTQMIAKGHDFPGVTLVGVLGTDNLLNFPDFRAAERSFTLLTQVAGRAGRATGKGKVFIQTYNPEHYSLTCAAEQNYADFYQLELPFRQELGYPPCGHLVHLVLAGNQPQQVKQQAEQLAEQLFSIATNVEVLGPSPCPLAKLRGKTRYQILLKSAARSSLRSMLADLEALSKNIPGGVGLSIDIDPVDML
ncbi:replication restart DNA helicase PriA [Malonomonas rubra DSM 5091]|uniref:Replication restart protein PriA n=1 Tax=Malonomonas rubra DSM 5091 TaxID=1122189 RepID=A0A1M6ICC9_MALRU|nr:primosomal protein N' [Malonomonas rubra]SHJ31966.1 replication restart DNA helicase PriA [Malonomonas rubra DSM 5091]